MKIIKRILLVPLYVVGTVMALSASIERQRTIGSVGVAREPLVR